MNIGISGVGHYLPRQVWTNQDLEKSLDTTDEWIFSKTGIRQRHIADPAEATSDLALEAARKALECAGLRAEDVDLIVLATSSPDMIQPSTAAILQGKLGAVNAVAFDVGAVCAGFVYAMVTATGMMRAFARYRTVLVVGAETYSRLLNWHDRSTCVFFGDGAGAVVLTRSGESGYLGHYLMNDGTGWDVIRFPAGGSRIPASPSSLEKGLHEFKMDGKKVWEFAIRAMPHAVRKAAEEAGCGVNQLDLVVSHQANINIIMRGMQELGLPMDKTHTTLEHTANTSGASIPIALSMACQAGKVKAGDLVACVGFGGGLSWGAIIFRWIPGVCQAVEKLNPADGVIRPGSAQTYARDVVRARWYRENLGSDLDPLIGLIRDGEAVVVDVSAGTGGASEYLLEQLAGQGKRLGRLVLTDVDIGMARGYMQYAMKALEGFASSTCEGIDYYILKNRGDGTFAKVSGIAGLRADLVIMANAIHLVPRNQLVGTLQGIFELLQPGGTAIIGSGSVLSAAKPAESVRVDELFEHVRVRALALIRTDDEYAAIREELGRRSGSPRVAERLAQVFPAPPTLEALLPVFREIGFDVRTRFHCTRLERDDYRPFIVGVAGYVKAAILPEAISDPKLSQDRALMSDEALMALARRAYEEVFDSVPGGHFSMWWTSITATRPPSSSCPGQAGKAGET